MQLTIEKLIYGGEGLARLPGDEHGRGKAVFVPFVLPGEVVEAALVEEKPGFARARVEKILQASGERVEPGCPYFQRCGGCHYQHARYEHQLAIEAEILKENLRRIAKVALDSEVRIHASPPWNYRNRTRLRAQCEPAFAIGYYKFGSHELLAVEACPISSPLINRAISATWKLGRAEMGAGLGEIEFFVDAVDSQLLVEVSRGPENGSHSATTKDTRVHEGTALSAWVEKLHGELPELRGVVVEADSRASLGRDGRGARPHADRAHSGGRSSTARLDHTVVYGAGCITYQTGRTSYRVSAGSFFQVNRYLTDELVGIVTDGRSGETAVDLYAGVGLFSTVLARGFRHIEAVESSQSSFADLKYNSPANVKAIHTSVAQYLQANARKVQPELVVVDPPRSGLGEAVARNLTRLGAPRITYVSCDPATLARDLKHLLAGGYRVEQAHLVDLFPQTYHLESVLQLVR